MQQVFNTSGTVNLENHHGHQESDDSTNKTDNADGDIYTGEEFSQDKEVEEELKHFNSNQFDGNINFFLHQDSRSNSSSPSRPTNDDKKHNDNLDDLNDKIDNYPKNYIIPLGLRKPFIVPFATARIKTKTTEPNSIPVITPKNKQNKQNITCYGKTYQVLNTSQVPNTNSNTNAFKTAREILLNSIHTNPIDTEDTETGKEINALPEKTHDHNITKKPNHGTSTFNDPTTLVTHSERNFMTNLATPEIPNQNLTIETNQKITGTTKNKDDNQNPNSRICVPHDSRTNSNLKTNYNRNIYTNPSNIRLSHANNSGWYNLNVKPKPTSHQIKLHHSYFIENSLKPHPDSTIDLPSDLECLRPLIMSQPKAFTSYLVELGHINLTLSKQIEKRK
jgi:hypothetical protein